jgi:hypothetical protein
MLSIVPKYEALLVSASKLIQGKVSWLVFATLGPDRDVDSAARFIQTEFMDRNLNKSKMIYPHFTTATDTSNIKVCES